MLRYTIRISDEWGGWFSFVFDNMPTPSEIEKAYAEHEADTLSELAKTKRAMFLATPSRFLQQGTQVKVLSDGRTGIVAKWPCDQEEMVAVENIGEFHIDELEIVE